jgi:hypothetical protein
MKIKTIRWALILGAAVFLMIVGGILFNSIQNSISRQLSPLQEMTGNLSTQVAQVLHPTPTILPDPVTIIHEIRSLARLETIKFSLEKIITAETRQGAFEWLVGDRLIFVAHAEVIAGIDLGQLEQDDLKLKNGVLYVQLPEPEVFLTDLDNEKSYVYDRETGIFTHGEVDLETLARREAEKEIEENAVEDGILELAQQNAEAFLDRLLRDLGFSEVVFE